ncbi:hypothetical protein GCM10009753_40850 [Streptantibioticus ferralitis]
MTGAAERSETAHGSPVFGPQPDVAGAAGHRDHPPRMGFFTNTSVCIGCKACEVACKEWNAVPEDGLVFTGMSRRRRPRSGGSRQPGPGTGR